MTQRKPCLPIIMLVLPLLIANPLLGQCCDARACASDSSACADSCNRNCAETVTYKDGTFSGKSTDWTGMKVEVTVKDGEIHKLKVLEANGTPEYYKDVVRRLPRRIVRRGTVEVDDLTGATLSSQSLKEAVRLALAQAAVKPEPAEQE